jgi:hypothetical protein
MGEQIEPSIKKGRGRAQHSIDLIEAMHAVAKKTKPNTGRGIGYQLFTTGLIPSMARSEMLRVYRLLKEAREEGKISASSWFPRKAPCGACFNRCSTFTRSASK